MIIETQKLMQVSMSTLAQLKNLTNHSIRGDFDDRGEYQGSHFRGVLRALEDNYYISPRVKNAQAFMARDPATGRIMGWCLLEIMAGHTAIDIGTYVDPEYRKRGAGALLVKEAIKYATSLQYVALIYAESWNKSSDRFYKSLGFKAENTYNATENGSLYYDVKNGIT
ncbi:MAG: Acetyltransferase (GNAT) family protein [Candidatus Dependentiae bacterium ADurb.Bin331]|nr:MAG: Acetyltransferase (GNAT) family protein [Candidatus Dependentiae bacterium ADurb.Bin331]